MFSTLWNRGFRISNSNWATFFSARIEVWQNGDEWVELTVRNQQACVTVEGKVN
ncbi:hypothetical protein [Muricoccus radiodurans]|uniref:hypothetical protein n=1 Tax=Muricoccus radiodurans TaxID=2231721 RepID=UPI003CEF3C65